jgi:RNA polymerase sigma-32 factor
MAGVAALSSIIAQSGLARYFEQIRRFPMLEPQEEFMLAKRWLERGERDAEHRLVTSHLRLVATIAAATAVTGVSHERVRQIASSAWYSRSV